MFDGCALRQARFSGQRIEEQLLWFGNFERTRPIWTPLSDSKVLVAEAGRQDYYADANEIGSYKFASSASERSRLGCNSTGETPTEEDI